MTASGTLRERTTQAPARARHAIRVSSLWKRYGALEAVRGIDLDVREGEIFGLIGPDGAGKTSTFQILAGVMEATSGTARNFRRAGARGAVANRLSDAGLQPVSRSDRRGKHPLHRRSAARAARMKFASAATAICACSIWTASPTAWRGA